MKVKDLKDLFVQCDKRHWNSITISKDSVGKDTQYICDKCQEHYKYKVTDKDLKRKNGSKVKYWGEK